MTDLALLADAAAHPPQPDPTSQPATQSVVIQPAAAPASAPMTLHLDTISSWAVAIVAIGALVALFYKLMTRELARDIADVRTKIDDVDHRARTTATRVDALEHQRTADIERLVRVEMAVAGIEKTAGRIEETLAKQFGELAVSIREIRAVSPR